jgi:O-antigen/teichoic acid export membrane protein
VKLTPRVADDMPAEPTLEISHGRYLALRLAQYGVIFVSSVVLARALGPSDRGQYALVLALASNVWILCHHSLEGAAGRLLGRGEATFAELTSFLTAAVLLVGSLGTAIALGLGVATRDSLLGGAGSSTILLASLTVPCLLVNQIAGYMLLLGGWLRSYAWAALIAAVLQLLAVLGIVVARMVTPTSATATTLLGAFAMAVLLAAMLARRVGLHALRPAGSRLLIRRMVVAGASLYPTSVAFQLSARIDLLLVGGLASPRAAGLYSISMTLADSLFLASGTLAQSGMSRQTTADESAAANFSARFARDCGHVAVISTIVAAIGAYPFVEVVYGPEWTGAVPPLIVLAIASIATAIQSPLQFFVIRVGRPRYLGALALVTLALNLGATVPLILAFGIVGAALGTLLAYTSFLLGTLLLFKRTRPELRARDVFRWPDRDDLVGRYLTLVAAKARNRMKGQPQC